jgi:acyl dehydratase
VKFAGFQAGQVIEAGPYPVSEEELVRFATSYDPQWFHADAVAAKRSRFGGLIASGWHTCAIAMRLVADAVLHDSESFASPGIGYRNAPQCCIHNRPGAERRSLRLGW